MNVKSRCKCCHHLKMIFYLCRSKMQLVQESPVSYQSHTFLKACGGESLLALMVTLTQPAAPGSSSELVAFAASDDWCEYGCSQAAGSSLCWGLYLRTPPLCLCSPALTRMVSRSPQRGGWGCLCWCLSYLGELGLCPSHCRHTCVEKTRVLLGHRWGSVDTSRAPEM